VPVSPYPAPLPRRPGIQHHAQHPDVRDTQRELQRRRLLRRGHPAGQIIDRAGGPAVVAVRPDYQLSQCVNFWIGSRYAGWKSSRRGYPTGISAACWTSA
jgi:hypothetical protein